MSLIRKRVQSFKSEDSTLQVHVKERNIQHSRKWRTLFTIGTYPLRLTCRLGDDGNFWIFSSAKLDYEDQQRLAAYLLDRVTRHWKAKTPEANLEKLRALYRKHNIKPRF